MKMLYDFFFKKSQKVQPYTSTCAFFVEESYKTDWTNEIAALFRSYNKQI
jgi:hypothetical protein